MRGHDTVADVTTSDPAIAAAARILAAAKSALFITGAGISADSGLPTYRGIGGLYDRGDTDEGVPIEVALSGAMMAANPELCWKYIAQIERACRDAKPNRAHEIIASLDDRLDRVCVLTQNVDGFHRAAGSQTVIEIHGTVHSLSCTRCRFRTEVVDYADLDIPPRCAECAGLVRPDVVLFGEILPARELARLAEQLSFSFDVVFSIGTTSAFPYIAQPVIDARRRGIPTVEINPGDSDVSDIVDIRIRRGARDAMEAIGAALQPP